MPAFPQQHRLEPIAAKAVTAADAGARAAFLQRVLWVSAATGTDEDPDICAHLFRLCRTFQAEYLDPRGIDCLIDIEPGRLSKRVCDVLGWIVGALIMDAAEHAIAGVGDKRIAVTLRRRGAIWTCVVAQSGIRLKRAAGPRSWLALAESLAAELNGNYGRRASHQGAIDVIDFAVDGTRFGTTTTGEGPVLIEARALHVANNA